jgi:putative ABC transport system permease protein
MNMTRLLMRQWQSQPSRAAATVASVAVAVGAVVATWAAADASRSGYRRLAETAEGTPSLVVSSSERERFEPSLVPRLADIPGVRATVPLVFSPVLMRAGGRRVHEMAVGVDVTGLVTAGLLTLATGRPCVAADEVVLDSDLAAGLGLAVDDDVVVLSRRRIVRLRITGLARGETTHWFAEGAGVMLGLAALESMSLTDGRIDRVRIALASDANRNAVRATVTSRLPHGLTVEVPPGAESLADDVLRAAHLGLDFVTGLTIAMAWFIVGNTMLMNVTERRRGLSLVRVLGGTSRQVQRLVVCEAAALGFLGAVVGAAAGMLAARPMALGISRALQVPELAPPPNPVIALVAAIAAVAVTVTAAWWPARSAAHLDMLEGLAAAPPPPRRGIAWRHVAVVILLATAAEGTLGLVAMQYLPPRASVPAGITLLLAFVALTPLVLPTIVRLLARLVPTGFRTERALAVEQVLRHPARTALTTGVMVVAVTNGIGLGHSIRDNVDDLLGWYARNLRTDWILTRAGLFTPAASDAAPRLQGLEQEVQGLAGVAAVDTVSVALGRISGNACVVVARNPSVDAATAPQGIEATPEEIRAGLEHGAALAGTMLATRLGIKAGDEVPVEVAGRTVRLRVAALVVDYTAGGSSLHVSRDTGRRLFGMEEPDIVLVTADEHERKALREPLARIAVEHGMILRSSGELQEFVNALVNGVVGSLWTILALGFVVGSMGVANTVTMNVLEQKRTLALLRAIGMDRRQVVRLVLLQSILLGAAGGLIGVTSGLVTAAFIQLASQPLVGHPVSFRLRPDVVAVNVAAAIAVTAAAAWLPARRALRMDLLESVTAE